MAIFRKDQPEPAKLPPPRSKFPNLEQPIRDTTHGHPGLPPRDYKAPREDRR